MSSSSDTTSSPSPSTAPSTPARVHPGVRRVHTLPTKLIDPLRASPSSSPSADSVETLFVHPSAKVVSFTTPAANRPGSSSGRRTSVDTSGPSSGTLSWVSPSERTLAAGPLKIYRVPSSGVSFLNSGSLLHPILQRSQCWCVDEGSKFVLRVREGSFYRIELPFESAEDKERVEEFKAVLKSILHYERTPSPFSREYVELPERPQTPVRRISQPLGPAKRWRLNKFWEPEDAAERARWSPSTPPLAPSSLKKELREPTPDSEGSIHTDESTEEEETVTEGTAPSDPEDSAPPPTLAEAEAPKPISLPFRLRPVQSRSVTAPPPLTIQTSSPPNSPPLTATTSRETDASSIASSRDSFYSLEGPPSPPAEEHSFHSLEQENDTIREQFANIKAPTHKRQASEMTIIPDTPTPLRTPQSALTEANLRNSDPDPGTPTLVTDSDESSETSDQAWADAITPPDTLRLRRLPNHGNRSQSRTSRRSLSPCSHPINLFSTPTAPSRAQHLTAALVQKAYALLIGPPAHLIALMLEIANKIIHGIPAMYDGSGKRARGRSIVPGSWEESADEEDEWDEDDFGIPLGDVPRASSASSVGTQSSGGHSSGVD